MRPSSITAWSAESRRKRLIRRLKIQAARLGCHLVWKHPIATYRIVPIGKDEDSAYYTEDADDAMDFAHCVMTGEYFSRV